MNKQEIVQKIKKERTYLEKVIPIMNDWSIKDIMMHLVWWEQHFLEMLKHAKDKKFPSRLQEEKLNIKKINTEVYEQYTNNIRIWIWKLLKENLQSLIKKFYMKLRIFLTWCYLKKYLTHFLK